MTTVCAVASGATGMQLTHEQVVPCRKIVIIITITIITIIIAISIVILCCLLYIG